MKIQNRAILVLGLAVMAAPAFATCPKGDTRPYPECLKPPVVTPPTPQPPSQHQGQEQGQHQGQHQGQTANGGNGTGVGVGIGQGGNATGGSSRSNATGGNATSGSSSGVTGSGNSRNSNRNNNAANASNTVGIGDVGSSSNAGASVGNTTAQGGYSGGNSLSNGSASTSGATSGGNSFDASDRSSTSIRSNVFVPGDLPSNAMNIVAGSYITTAGDTECGPLLQKVRTPIYQWDKRGKKKREVGFDEDIAPYLDANGVQLDYQRVETGNGGYYLRGSAATYVLGSYGGSNSSQLGVQGYGPGGGGGVAYGSGNAYSQAGVRVIIRPCIAARYDAKPVAKARPAVRKRKPARRAPAPRPAACIPAQRICPAK